MPTEIVVKHYLCDFCSKQFDLLFDLNVDVALDNCADVVQSRSFVKQRHVNASKYQCRVHETRDHTATEILSSIERQKALQRVQHLRELEKEAAKHGCL